MESKASTNAKPFHIRLDELDRFIKVHDKIRYLILFDYNNCDEGCDKIKYLISEKRGITDSVDHNFARIRIDSFDSLPFKKVLLSFRNVIILIKSVVNKNINYYYNMLLEKGLYEGKSNTEYFSINACIS